MANGMLWHIDAGLTLSSTSHNSQDLDIENNGWNMYGS